MGLDMFILKYEKQNKNSRIADEQVGEVCYWRKANQIHNWFDNQSNTEYGLDNCEEMEITYEMIQELLETCEEVLDKKDTNVSQNLLPIMRGCFFGNYEYNDYYYDEVDYTIKKLTDLLNEWDSEAVYKYHGWW